MVRFPKTILRVAALLLAASAAFGRPAQAADRPSLSAPTALPAPAVPFRPFFVRLGITGVFFDQSLSGTSIAGQSVGGGGVKTGSIVTAAAEAGYFFTPAIAVSVAGGWPPLLTEKGTGVFAPFGTLARARAGVITTMAHYHADFGRFHPYVGGGVAFAIVFHNVAGAIAQPALHNNVGAVVGGGVDFDLTERWSLFVDVKNVWVNQRMTGLAAPFPGGPAILPLKTRVHNDLVLLTAGLGYRF